MKISINTATVVGGFILFSFLTQAHSVDLNGDLEVKHQGKISYVSGGVGRDELLTIRSMRKEFNLKMEFSAASGEFLADVKVSLIDNKGNVLLDTVSDGPCLYADIPTGRYKVKAETLGRAITNNIDLIGKKTTNVHFHWHLPKNLVDMEPREQGAERETNPVRGCF